MTQNDKPNLFVVDGSNVATEGRSKPSLDQLNEAVVAFRDQYPDVKVTVVVDATFGHRIAKKEVKAFDKAVAANELVTPPAGAVGRGDAFILAIADKSGAGVFSNDSFQEFHGEYAWLFETGRLIGGKPVPNVGWVFVDRNPVRGRKSRESIKAAKADQGDATPTEAKEKAQRRVRKKKAAATDSTNSSETSTEPASAESANSEPAPAESESSGSPEGSTRSKRRRRGSSNEAREPKSGSTGSPKSSQVNDPGAFFDFVEHHQVGARVKGVVDSYASHGAYARVGDVLIYIPLRLMADPAPTSARKVLTTGDEIDLVIVAYVPDRLSIDASLPAMAPSATRAESSDDSSDDASSPPKKRASRRRSKKRAASAPAADGGTPVKRSAAKKKAAKKSAAKKAPAKKKAAAKRTPAKKKAAAKRAPAKKTTAAKKAPAKKAATKKAPAKKKAAARRGSPRKKAAADSPAPDSSS